VSHDRHFLRNLRTPRGRRGGRLAQPDGEQQAAERDPVRHYGEITAHVHDAPRELRGRRKRAALVWAKGTSSADQSGRTQGVTPDLRSTASWRIARLPSRIASLRRRQSERLVAARRTSFEAEPAVTRYATDERPAALAGRESRRLAVARPGTRRDSADPTALEDPTSVDLPTAPADTDPPPSTRGAGLEQAAAPDRSGLVPGVVAGLCFAMVVATSRMNVAAVGRILIPVGAILAAIAVGQILVRRHPDEPWLPRLLVAAVVVKLAGSILRFYTLVGEEGFHGDSSIYDKWGVNLFHAWTSGGAAPDPYTGAGAGTGWVRWFTGVVYFVFGPNMLNGFLLFGLLALIGSYLWYRAAVEAVPFLNKRMCFALMFFVPSIAFWPSSIGKEALMQLGLGAVALGTARILRQRLFQGILFALPGGYLLWKVRPHLLAFATFAAGAAYVFGRVRKGRSTSESTSLFKPIGMVVVALLAFVALNQAAEFLGMKDFSLSSIEQELNQQSGRTAQGGSKVETEKVTLTPATVPQGVVKVLLQPFPWEVETRLQILASLESAALGGLIILRIRSVAFSLRRARTTPFFVYCWTLVLLYAISFSAVSNYGLLTRQRSLALPALFVILAADPALAKAGRSKERLGPTSGAVGVAG
jgi:hypothetical protein